MVPIHFSCNSSRPLLLKGFNQGTQGELLASIRTVLTEDFKIFDGVEAILGNTAQHDGSKERVDSIVLIGASNLRRVAANLTELGYKVTDLCVPGWLVSPNNVDALLRRLQTVEIGPGTAVVFDIYGNSCIRYQEYDGSTSRPFKFNGGTHLAGEVVVCDEKIFQNVLDISLPLLQVLPGQIKIILPPPA
jgi:hypothetical protein